MRRAFPLLLILGCWVPEFDPNQPQKCELPAHPCVDGFNCVQGLCVRDGGATTDAGSDGGRDGGPDAGTPDGGCVPAYRDEDLDSEGAGPSIACQLGPGLAARNGDCDDGDPFSAPDASELCDGRDNNCNGTVDEGRSCPLAWETRSDTGGAGEDWETVAISPVEDVWMAGQDGRVAYLAPGASNFDRTLGNCGTSQRQLQASAAHLASPRVYLGGSDGTGNGVLVIADRLADSCLSGPITGTDVVTGLTILRSASGGGGDATVLAVTADGGSFEWTNSAVSNRGAAGIRLSDVHGAGGLVIAVGHQGSEPRIARYDGGGWIAESVSSASGPLAAVHVVNANEAYAVGSNGLVLRRTSSGWARLQGPGNQDLTGVVAFGRSQVYIVDTQGSVRRSRRDGGWETLMPGGGKPLYDLAGLRPDELWAVGPDGLVVHWAP